MSVSPPAALATTRDETPVFFPAGNETLFGVFTRPTIDPLGTAVLVLPGVGFATMINRNRLAVRLSRRLAAAGFHALRIEYQGVGESTGTGAAYALERPFMADVEGAIRWIEGQGITRILVVGTCFGAWNALMGTWRFPRIRGAVLVSIPSFVEDEMAAQPLVKAGVMRRRLRRLFDARQRALYIARAKTAMRARLAKVRGRIRPGDPAAAGWVRKEFVDAVEALIERRVRLLLAFGTDDKEYHAFDRARARVDPLLARGAGLIDVVVLPGQVHGLPNLELQEQVLDLIVGWLIANQPTGTD